MTRPPLAKSISKFGKGQNVFAQGDVADAVFYIQEGKIKLTVVSDQGKEASSGFWSRDNSLARAASMVIHCVLPLPRQRRPVSSREYRRRR